jgi:site-specific DNA-methyltransferase (adenine-specific)
VAIWVNIPDDTAAEIVVHLKSRGLFMVNWCVWHYRFGQNVNTRFINSKVHALYFAKLAGPRPTAQEARFKYIAQGGAPAGEMNRVWNPEQVLEVSDRRAIYGDARTESKNDGMPSGMRLPMDVWYGKFWGRIQGNNKERCPDHDNQLPEVYLERVVRACSDEGMLVMDPFVGSGTTGVVAHALGRNFIGIEYSEDNAQRAAERIKRGPIRELNGGGQSTAIFPQRVVPRKKRARRAKTDPDPTLL